MWWYPLNGVLAECFFTLIALGQIQRLLEDILIGSLGKKRGQKYLYTLPWKDRLSARSFREKLKRWHREFDGYLHLRRWTLTVTAACLGIEWLLWLVGQQDAAKALLLAHAAVLIVQIIIVGVHAREWQNASKYTRARPTKAEK